MTSKDKVNNALDFIESNSVPRFLWFSNKTREVLEKEFGLHGPELDIYMGNDILQTWLSINGEMEREVEEGSEFVDEWGITWRKSGSHNMVINHPLQNADLDTIEKYPIPNPFDPIRYKSLEHLVTHYGNDYFIGADVSGTIFEHFHLEFHILW